MLLWITICVLLVFSVAQAILVLFFGGECRRVQRESDSHEREGGAIAILLCARGNDPALCDGLKSLADQAGERVRVYLVVDDASDPAVEAFERANLRDDSRFELMIAPPNGDRCSLKCHSLSFAVERLMERVDVFCMLDSDARPGNDWLNLLVSGVRRPGVGVAYGNRWYIPPDRSLGAWVRHCWNAAAIVQMQLYRIVWGGSFAIRTTAIQQAQLVRRWKQALFEDALLADTLKDIGLRAMPVPGLFLVNHDRCSVGEAYRWMTRQLLDARWYHRQWPLIFLHAVFSAILPYFLISMMLVAAIHESADALIWFFIWLFFQAFNWVLLKSIGRTVAGAMEAAGNPLAARSNRWHHLALFGVIPIVQLMNALAAISAVWMRRVRWRGIEYRIRSAWDVQRKSYEPMIKSK